MPKSILDIEVNDAQFKNYLDAFNKYRDAAKQMPAVWGEVDASVLAIGAGFAAMAIELERQYEQTQKLADAEAKRLKAEKEAQSEKRRALKEQSDHEKESEQRRRRAIEDTRRIAQNVADTAVSLGKWALLGEGMALAGGVLGFWGLDRLVSGVAQERRQAQGYGVTTGQRQSLGVNMQRYFDVNSLLENIAETKADPSRWWVMKAMGLNPQEDNAKLATDAALAARRMFISDRGNEALANAQGLTSMFSMDELRRMAATPEAQLRASAGQAGRDAAPGGRFFLADQVSLKWQNFVTALDGASLALKNKLVDKLTVLEPNLEKIMGKFTDLAVQVLDRIDFDKLGAGLDTFTKYIGSPQFQKDFKTVVDDISYAANKLSGAMQVLGLLPDPSVPTTAADLKAADAADDARKWDRIRRAGAGALAGQPGIFAAADDGLGVYAGTYAGTGFNKGGSVAARLQGDLGVGHGAAAGIVGNLLAEDPGLVAMNEKHPMVPGSRGGFGWAMWTGPRRREFEAWAAANHMDPHSDQANYGFLVHELRTKFAGLLRKIQHETAAQAAADVYRVFEAPAKGDRTLGARVRNAQRVDVNVHNQTGASVYATANAASQ